MKKPQICLIAAIGRNRELGKNNRLIWNIPEDLKYFRKITSGYPVIMGQRTFESIGQPLSKRENIILSKDKKFKAVGCKVAGSVNQAVDEAKKSNKDKIFFIGGASVYNQSIKLADKLYLTLIDKSHEADVFFPDYSIFRDRRKVGGGTSGNLSYEFWEMEK